MSSVKTYWILLTVNINLPLRSYRTLCFCRPSLDFLGATAVQNPDLGRNPLLGETRGGSSLIHHLCCDSCTGTKWSSTACLASPSRRQRLELMRNDSRRINLCLGNYTPHNCVHDKVKIKLKLNTHRRYSSFSCVISFYQRWTGYNPMPAYFSRSS